MTTLSAAVLLFLVMDPLGNIPFFLSALKTVEPARQTRVIVRELLIALGVLVVFLFLGQHILKALAISEPALTLSGGVILFLIALRMIFPSAEKPLREDVHGEPFIVPLAIPYVAGPSALATELLLMSQDPERYLDWLIALFLAWLAASVILLCSGWLRRILSEKGMVAMERLMGMILVAVSIQMLLTGIKAAMPPAGAAAASERGMPGAEMVCSSFHRRSDDATQQTNDPGCGIHDDVLCCRRQRSNRSSISVQGRKRNGLSLRKYRES
jgi:multiple antibiotic resistance protein